VTLEVQTISQASACGNRIRPCDGLVL